MSDKYSMVRKVALISMVVFDLAMLGIFAWAGMWYWFWAFVAINLVIGIAEIWSALKRGKTISTYYKYWIERDKKRAYLALLCMGLSLMSLLVHLGVVKIQEEDEK